MGAIVRGYVRILLALPLPLVGGSLPSVLSCVLSPGRLLHPKRKGRDGQDQNDAPQDTQAPITNDLAHLLLNYRA